MSQLAVPHEFPFDDRAVSYRVDAMRESHLDQVMQIEMLAFPAPWPASAYRYELTHNTLSAYFVLRPRRQMARVRGWERVARLWKGGLGPIVGYGGFWSILDEAHISTVAVQPGWRGRGLGELMFVALIDAAILRGAAEVALEVRASNEVAQRLYRKYGLVEVGRRKGYYHDNNEDALIMTVSGLDQVAFPARYGALKADLRDRLIRDVTIEARGADPVT